MHQHPVHQSHPPRPPWAPLAQRLRCRQWTDKKNQSLYTEVQTTRGSTDPLPARCKTSQIDECGSKTRQGTCTCTACLPASSRNLAASSRRVAFPSPRANQLCLPPRPQSATATPCPQPIRVPYKNGWEGRGRCMADGSAHPILSCT